MFEERMRRSDAMFADAACMEEALLRNAVSDQVRENNAKHAADVQLADANSELLRFETLERSKQCQRARSAAPLGRRVLRAATEELKRKKQELKACKSSVEYLQREREEAVEAVLKANAGRAGARAESQLVEVRTDHCTSEALTLRWKVWRTCLERVV